MHALRIILISLAACIAMDGSDSSAADGAEHVLSFPTRILPILTKAGCNAGACHGAAIGQGGFKLSLLGYDPQADYLTITRQFNGRRIDFSSPASSLLLRKATRDIRHKGGQRIDPDSADYRLLVNWIKTAAPYGARDLWMRGIRVSPGEAIEPGIGRKFHLRVLATLSNGESEDVTAHALYNASDDAIAAVDEDGIVQVLHSGVTTVMIRYGGQVAAMRVGAPFGHADLNAGDFPPNNFIDRQVWTQLRQMRVPPSPLSNDAEFLRRVYLDGIGRLPSAAEARSFLAAPSTSESRARLIGQLLTRSEFADFWTLRLADLLLIDSKRLGVAPARAYRDWVREQIAQNVPMDRFVNDLLSASGDITQNPAANFHRTVQDPRDMGEFVSGTFLGVQIACARCHAHPFAAWTQDDYYGFAAIFARTRMENSRLIVADDGEVQHPKTGKDAAPMPLGATPFHDRPGSDRRVQLARWLTAPDNPYFARAMVNRIWNYMTGRGIAEPVDDLRVTNPPSNQELLDALAADFVASGYDLRHLIQTIAESRTYQLSSRSVEGNEQDQTLFSHARVKPLMPQVLADAIADATQIPDEFSGYKSGTRAVQLVDARTPSYALDVLGRCTRDTACERQPRGGGMSQALHLMNGSTINDKLRAGAVDRLLRACSSDAQIVEELYLRTLSRFPSEAERTFCIEALKGNPVEADKRQPVEDLFWALLNSREFSYNH